MYSIEIGHNFETAHRLVHPDAPEKCRSIHGHSWWVLVTISGPRLDDQGMLVEFGAFKKAWRAFLDTQVDHHLAVVDSDPLIGAIRGVMPDARILALSFDPTTEHLARWLYEKAAEVLDQVVSTDKNAGVDKDVRVSRVHLQETRVNAATYAPKPHRRGW